MQVTKRTLGMYEQRAPGTLPIFQVPGNEAN